MIRMLNDRVAVKRDEAETRKPSGLYLPPSAQDRPSRGTVVAVGPGRLRDDGGRDPVSLQPGERVLFPVYSSNEVEVDGQTLLVLDASQVLAVIE